jgi:hypothetical protein
MSNPWDSWASNTDNWNVATYHWEDYYLSPASYAASLTGYAPDNPNNHILYPDSVTLILNGISPGIGISLAPNIGAGSLSLSGSSPIYAKGIFKSIPQGTISLDLIKWENATTTWASDPNTWGGYGRAPIVGQTHSYDPISGILVIEGLYPTPVWKDPTWKPTVWII